MPIDEESSMTEPDYTKYCDLERYLFDEVSKKFQLTKQLTAFEFFCIVIWKANRVKSKVADRLLAQGHKDLNAAAKALSHAVGVASDSKGRLRVLIEEWGFRLPMASAILAVLYPDEFTVYDVRVCGVLDDFGDAQYKKFDALWARYEEYIERIRRQVPGKATLRERDRYLWGKSFESQLTRDIQDRFGRGVDDSELDA